ncbi:MAG: SRPBCC family protein [Caulobacteraceae bacterium]
MPYDSVIDASTSPLSARRDSEPNVTGVEWAVSLFGGALLGAWGMRRRGFPGAVAEAVGGMLVARAVTGRCPAKRALAETSTERALAREHGWRNAAPVGRAITVNKPRSEVYAFWRDLPNLARFLLNVERIEVSDELRSHWTVKSPTGEVQWDSRITADEPDRRIAWESEPGADIRNTGEVVFKDAPGGRGTEVHASIVFEPPGGKVGRIVAALFQRDPAIQLRRDMRRFKQLMETGEISTSKPPLAAPRGV